MVQNELPKAAFPWVQVLLAAVLLVSGLLLLLTVIPPVTLSWETASEVGTAGFNVYRAAAPGGDFVPINTTLIPAAGNELLGAAYRFEDDAVVLGRRYAYRIEEVEWDGSINLYPETVTVRAGLPRFWTKVEGGILLLVALFLLRRSFKR
ncbi:MAG TPA: hypothetical protein PLH19_02695 [Anaerolineae bacterium]|nr:hypothetical protein [Anaerolineae bacterium]HQH37428.1 hypothetical protein [Anaerolineae bacterium]